MFERVLQWLDDQVVSAGNHPGAFALVFWLTVAVVVIVGITVTK